jgi:hypothetical protein
MGPAPNHQRIMLSDKQYAIIGLTAVACVAFLAALIILMVAL